MPEARLDGCLQWSNTLVEFLSKIEETFRKVYSGFSTVFLSLLLLAVGVGFPAACFWR